MDRNQAKGLAAMQRRGLGRTRVWGAQAWAGYPLSPRAGPSSPNHHVGSCLGTRAHTRGRSRPSPSRLVRTLKPKGRSCAEAAWEARWAQVGSWGFALNPGGRLCGGTRTPRPLFTMFTSAGKGEGRRGKEGEGEGIRVEGRQGWGNTNPGTLRSTKLWEEDKVQNCGAWEVRLGAQHTVCHQLTFVEWIMEE